MKFETKDLNPVGNDIYSFIKYKMENKVYREAKVIVFDRIYWEVESRTGQQIWSQIKHPHLLKFLDESFYL